MAIRPIHDRIVVRRLKSEETSKGGIIIPDTAKEKRIEAVVIAVGPGKYLEDGTLRPTDVRTGDRVVFGAHAGNEVKYHGEEITILNENDVLGVVSEDGKVFRPLRDKVLVRRKKAATTYGNSGLLVPEEYREKANEGVVVAAGDGMWNDWAGGKGDKRLPMSVAAGDYVLWGQYAGSDNYDPTGGRDGTFVVLRDEEILGVDDGKADASRRVSR